MVERYNFYMERNSNIGLTKKSVWVFPYHVIEKSEFLILTSYFACNLITLKLFYTSFCLLKIQSILFHICGMFCDTFLFCSKYNHVISSFILLSMCWEVTPFLFLKYITWQLIGLLIKCCGVKLNACGLRNKCKLNWKLSFKKMML